MDLSPREIILVIVALMFILGVCVISWDVAGRWRKRQSWKNVPRTVFRIPDDCKDQPRRVL
jgi:hypothetical protein